MSYLNLNTLSPAEMIAHFVLECRGGALFLPYEDYGVIEVWLQASTDPDELLLVLSDVLPDFFAKSRSGKRPLEGARVFVLKRLEGLRMRQAHNSLELLRDEAD